MSDVFVLASFFAMYLGGAIGFGATTHEIDEQRRSDAEIFMAALTWPIALSIAVGIWAARTLDEEKSRTRGEKEGG